MTSIFWHPQANAVTGALLPSVIAAAVVAVEVFGWRSYRREPLRKAVPGLLMGHTQERSRTRAE